MRGQRLWTIAIAVLITMAATKYVSAQVETRAISQLTGDDADNTVTFRVRIRNISGDSDLPTFFTPGVWVLHSEAAPFFTSSEAGRGDGLRALAEEGGPAALADALRAQGFLTGVFDTPVCADGPGPLPSEIADGFGNTYEFEVTASPDSPYLSFATMLVQSNDMFLLSGENGIALFDEDGSAIGVQNVTDKLLLWDAGTEVNGESGAGASQTSRQSDLNAGSANEIAKERSVDDGFSFPNIADLVEVYILPDLMVDRDRGRQLPPPADHQVGKIFQVGDVQWQVHSARILGDKLTATKKMLTTDERFVLVRFSFLNLGSDPLEFDGGPRNRKGVPLRDDQGREHTYYLEPRTGRADKPPHDYVLEDENCYGRWRFERWWRPFELKPNSPTTCSIIYEVSVDATNLVFVASELSEDKVGARETVDLNLPSIVSPHSIGENVQVGDVRWHVYGAEDLGKVLSAEDGKLKTRDRFVRVRFHIQNKGSETLRFDVVEDVKLRDSLGREHEHYLVPRIGPDRYPVEVLPDDEECRGYELKPNMSTTCTAIYEVDGKTTGLIFAAGDLGGTESGIEIIDLGLSSREAFRIHLDKEDVEVGDMCWRVLSAENLGRVLKNNGEEERADGKFIRVRFRILNLGSEILELDDASAALIGEQGQTYFHYHVVRDLWPDRHPVEHIPDNEACYHIDLKPNIPTTCTMIYDVVDDSENSFVFLASDLEGYETSLVGFSPEGVESCTVERRPISVGKHEVCEEVNPGIYRGEGLEESPCLWARLDSFEAGFDSAIATRTHDGQFYVEILDSDAAFSTDCNLESIDSVPPPDPRLTSLLPGMYLVDKDIAPGQYEGIPSEGLYCFWQRLNCVTGEEHCAVDWGLEGAKYQVKVSATDLAVEFACPVEKALPDFQRIYDSRLGYSLAVPDGWYVTDLQRVDQHPIWGTFSKVYSVAAKGIEDVLASPGGENVGYLALELDLFPKPSIKTMALVGTTSLDDDIPAETVVLLLSDLIESFDMFPVGAPEFVFGTTKGLPSIQGVVTADLSSQGLFNAHAVVTALRANDTAYILLVVTEVKDVKVKQPLIDQIVGTFRPE